MPDYFADPTRVQVLQQAVPETMSYVAGGGRGSGKTRALLNDGIRHVIKYGKDARVLFIKQTAKGLSEVLTDTEMLLIEIFGKDVRLNRQNGMFQFSSGAVWRFEHIFTKGEYARKLQGISATLLLCDEATAWHDCTIFDLCKSNLRSGNKSIPLRWGCAMNPGNVGHTVWAERYAFKANGTKPTVFMDGEEEVCYLHSTFRDNQHLHQEQYEKNLRASTNSEALLEAWLTGSFRVAIGAYFSGALREDKNMVNVPLFDVSEFPFLRPICSYDHGTAKPCSWLIAVVFKENATLPFSDQRFIVGDVLVLDEFSTARETDVTDGGGESIESIALEIQGLCAQWGVKPVGYGDDAMWADQGLGSLRHAFGRMGVRILPAQKRRRVPGWMKLISLFKGAHAEHREDPGIFINKRCWLFWRTVPFLMTSEHIPEDLQKCDSDNSADSIRYLICRKDIHAASSIPSFNDPAFRQYQNAIRISKAVSQDKLLERAKKKGIKTVNFAAQRGGRLFTQAIGRR